MILIALGSNLPSHAGAPAETLRAALMELSREGVAVRAVSPFYVTPAWPDSRDPSYVNAVARVATELSPDALMAKLHAIEARFGRTRGERNAPRTLDLDIVDYEGRAEAGPPVLPHPRLEQRAFVLVPLADVAPDWRHPVSGRSIATLIEALPRVERDSVRPA